MEKRKTETLLKVSDNELIALCASMIHVIADCHIFKEQNKELVTAARDVLDKIECVMDEKGLFVPDALAYTSTETITFNCGTPQCPGHSEAPFCNQTMEDVIKNRKEIANYVHLSGCSCLMQEKDCRFSNDPAQITCMLCKMMINPTT